MPENDKELTELIERAESLCTGHQMSSIHQSNAMSLVQRLRKKSYLIGEGKEETMARLKQTLDEGEASYRR